MKLPLWRFFVYALVILVGLAIALPTFLPRNLSQDWPIQPVSLGLDLRGGASLTLQADEAAIREGLLSDYTSALAEKAPGLRARTLPDRTGLTIAIPDGMTPKVRWTPPARHCLRFPSGRSISRNLHSRSLLSRMC